MFYRRVWIEMSNNKVRAAASHHDWINKFKLDINITAAVVKLQTKETKVQN